MLLLPDGPGYVYSLYIAASQHWHLCHVLSSSLLVTCSGELSCRDLITEIFATNQSQHPQNKAHIHIHIYIYIYIYTCVWVGMYIYIYTHVYMHIYIHATKVFTPLRGAERP